MLINPGGRGGPGQGGCRDTASQVGAPELEQEGFSSGSLLSTRGRTEDADTQVSVQTQGWVHSWPSFPTHPEFLDRFLVPRGEACEGNQGLPDIQRKSPPRKVGAGADDREHRPRPHTTRPGPPGWAADPNVKGRPMELPDTVRTLREAKISYARRKSRSLKITFKLGISAAQRHHLETRKAHRRAGLEIYNSHAKTIIGRTPTNRSLETGQIKKKRLL